MKKILIWYKKIYIQINLIIKFIMKKKKKNKNLVNNFNKMKILVNVITINVNI